MVHEPLIVLCCGLPVLLAAGKLLKYNNLLQTLASWHTVGTKEETVRLRIL